MGIFSDPWPWYVAGPLIGLYVPVVYWLVNRHFGVSSSLRDICATVAPKRFRYFDYNWREYLWRVFFVAGIALGGFIGATLLKNPGPVEIAGRVKQTLSSYGVKDYSALVPLNFFSWESLLTTKGFVLVVVGGFLVGFGTRYADGCTSGHTIHGVANFHRSSIIASLCFFIGGLFTSYVVLPLILKP